MRLVAVIDVKVESEALLARHQALVATCRTTALLALFLVLALHEVQLERLCSACGASVEEVDVAPCLHPTRLSRIGHT